MTARENEHRSHFLWWDREGEWMGRKVGPKLWPVTEISLLQQHRTNLHGKDSFSKHDLFLPLFPSLNRSCCYSTINNYIFFWLEKFKYLHNFIAVYHHGKKKLVCTIHPVMYETEIHCSRRYHYGWMYPMLSVEHKKSSCMSYGSCWSHLCSSPRNQKNPFDISINIKLQKLASKKLQTSYPRKSSFDEWFPESSQSSFSPMRWCQECYFHCWLWPLSHSCCWMN